MILISTNKLYRLSSVQSYKNEHTQRAKNNDLLQFVKYFLPNNDESGSFCLRN